MKKRTSMREVCCFVFEGDFHMRRMLKRTAATLLSLALRGTGLTAMLRSDILFGMQAGRQHNYVNLYYLYIDSHGALCSVG